MHITLKLATSLDGKIALGNGQSQWITGPAARAAGHRLRATHDAVMVGSGTALADNPVLTVRLTDFTRPQPLRVVADRRLRLPINSQLATTTDQGRVVVLTTADGGDDLKAQGVEVVPCGTSVADMVETLGTLGVQRLMIEGGATLAAAFIKAGLVSELHWFRAPVLIGGDGLDAVAALGLTALDQARRLTPVSMVDLGTDRHEVYQL